MDQQDRLAYEAAMATLRDTREDCLRWLDDRDPVLVERRPVRWWSGRGASVTAGPATGRRR